MKTVNHIIEAIRNADTTPAQRESLNRGSLHHPSHYIPQIIAIARKVDLLADGEQVRKYGK